jgi:inhibitor of growth protein 3
MPRDDLSIDFVKRMPQAEPLDPGIILEDWINRVQNLPEEIQFVQSEVADKDRQYNECVRIIEDRDGKIQNGSRPTEATSQTLRRSFFEPRFARTMLEQISCPRKRLFYTRRCSS